MTDVKTNIGDFGQNIQAKAYFLCAAYQLETDNKDLENRSIYQVNLFPDS